MSTNNDELLYDEDDSVKFIQNYLPQELKGKFSNDDINYIVDLIYDFYESNGMLDDDGDDEIEIDPKDLKIDIFMSSGPGGQSVNTTYSAVRMTHIPTGIVVSMQDEKSQIQNRAAALRVLKSRLLAMKHEQEAAEAADMRHSQVRSLDRSERIRTYNFPENRIVDHRTNYKAYNLDAVLDGDLQAVIDSDIQADEEQRLASQQQQQ